MLGSGLVLGLWNVVYHVQYLSNVAMVGASGAISGVMGAYLVLFPRVRVFTMVPLGLFLTSVALPAWVILVYWTVQQVAGDEHRRRPGWWRRFRGASLRVRRGRHPDQDI